MKNIISLNISVVILVFSLINSGEAQWIQTNGPYGGNIRCFAFSGTNLFAGTQGMGVFPINE